MDPSASLLAHVRARTICKRELYDRRDLSTSPFVVRDAGPAGPALGQKGWASEVNTAVPALAKKAQAAVGQVSAVAWAHLWTTTTRRAISVLHATKAVVSERLSWWVFEICVPEQQLGELAFPHFA